MAIHKSEDIIIHLIKKGYSDPDFRKRLIKEDPNTVIREEIIQKFKITPPEDICFNIVIDSKNTCTIPIYKISEDPVIDTY